MFILLCCHTFHPVKDSLRVLNSMCHQTLCRSGGERTLPPAHAWDEDLSESHVKFIQREEEHRFIRKSTVVLHSGALSQTFGSALALWLWTCRQMTFHSPELFFQSFSNQPYRGKMLLPNGWHFLHELKCLQGLGLHLQQSLPVSVL